MTARSALDGARPVLARMDMSRGPDNTKADLIAVWSAVEAALRSLVGDATVGGQALIREARSRQLLSFDQANALVALQSVRERLDGPGYQPTDADVNAGRAAFLKLDAGLMTTGPSAAPSPYSPQAAGTQTPAGPPASITPPSPGLQPMMQTDRPRWVLPTVLGVIALILVGGAAWWLTHRGGSSDLMSQGISAYQRGDRVTAASDFERASRANPNDAAPHVYLARMAREVGNYTIANSELQAALKADPASLQGRREYGSLFLSQGNYDQARVWYIHALEVDPSDVTSQGWLGCAMIKLNRIEEGLRWLGRAGNGPWSVCRSAAAPAPGVTPP